MENVLNVRKDGFLIKKEFAKMQMINVENGINMDNANNATKDM